MKLNKKLLILVLSLVMLVGIFTVSAFAAEDGVLTVKYQDGTVQTYQEGETIVPPAVPAQFVAYDADGKAYLYTTTGTAWEGLPETVTPDLLGTTVEATVAGTKGTQQVYYVTQEQLAADAPITTVYHMNNNVHQYLSSANTGDKGDGTNTGAAPFTTLGLKATNVIRIKLYADVDVSSFAINLMQGTRQYKAIPTYLDLNGHTVKTTQTGFIDVKSVEIRVYSSVPGAHWYQTSAASMFRANDDATVVLGSQSNDLNFGDEGNISFHCKSLFGSMYGNGGYVRGGKYYQTEAGTVGFVDLSRRIPEVSCAEFYTLDGVAPLTDIVAHNGTVSVATGAASVKYCKFYNASGADLLNATQAANIVLENCTFVNINLANKQGTGTVNLKDGCVSSKTDAAVYTDDKILARIDSYAYTGLVAEDGTAISATIAYKITAAAETLAITTDAGTSYWTVGATFDADAGDYVKLDGIKLYLNPEYKVEGVAEIADGKIAAAGAVTLEVVFTLEDVVAFTYKDTKTGLLYGVGYESDCGGTGAGVFEKFYELFNAPASAYVITMYKDMTVNKAMGFGPLVEDRQTDAYNRDYYNTCVAGNIIWDLNGCTVTVAADTTGFINPTAANHKLTEPNGWNSGNPKTVFCFEGGANGIFTVKSSAKGGKIVNEAPGALFGVGEGKGTRVSFEGENLTIESKNHWIFFGIELGYDYVSKADPRLTIDGGTYIGGYASGIMQFCGNSVVKNATFIATNADVKQVTTMDSWRNGNITFDNVIFIASKDTAPAFYSTLQSGRTRNATFNNCVYIGCEPTTTARSPITSLTYTGTNLASTEENLALIYASAPEGTAKLTFDLIVANANGGTDEVNLLGYAAADQVYTVTYSGADVTKTYLVGRDFAPIAMNSAYYTVAVNTTSGLVNLPIAWTDVPAAGILAASFGGQTVTVSPADNWLRVAFILESLDDGSVLAYTLADSETVGADIAAAVSAAEVENAYLYIYQDVTVPAITFNTAFQIQANGHVITVAGTLTANMDVTIYSATLISALQMPFLTADSLLFENSTIYLSGASFVVNGSGHTGLRSTSVYVLGDAIPLIAFGAHGGLVSGNVRLANVTLGSRVAVRGFEATTVLGTAGTFAGCTYDDGVIADLIVNNRTETITVLGETYEVAYAEAATTDASKAIEVTYVYKDEARGTQNYYYGSIASFYSEFTDGYYFAYEGENALVENVTIECTFHADASKLQAQIVLTDALNYVFYLQVEDAGVLANLNINGAAIDLDSLAQVEIEGVLFYEIPVEFATFADALADYVLSVDLVSETSTLTITASAALDEYFAAALAAAEDAELVYTVAEYVVALVEYFDYDFAYSDVRMKNLGRINNLLAAYAEYKADLPALPEETDFASDYIVGALLVADEKVTFAFHVADGFDGSIVINGYEVALDKPFEGFDRTYALHEVSFEELNYEISVTVLDADGNEVEWLTYTLADYIAGVIAQNEGVAADYAKALWKLAIIAG